MFVIAILLYLLWLPHLDTEASLFFDFFLIPDWSMRLYYVHCCVVVVVKLKNCCVPSSGYLLYVLTVKSIFLFNPQVSSSYHETLLCTKPMLSSRIQVYVCTGLITQLNLKMTNVCYLLYSMYEHMK